MGRALQPCFLALTLALAAGGAAAAATVDGVVSAELRVSPRVPSFADPVQLSAAITWHGCPIVFQAPVVSGFQIAIDAAPNNPIPCPVSVVPQTYRYITTVPALPRGTYTALLRLSGVEVATAAFSVDSHGPDLFLFEGGRFEALLAWQDHGTQTYASNVRLTGQSGYFWFFDSGNVEVTVKILDGRALNGHFWVFVASMTDVPFTLTFIDLAGTGCQARNCPQRIYESPAGKNTNFIDIAAFE